MNLMHSDANENENVNYNSLFTCKELKSLAHSSKTIDLFDSFVDNLIAFSNGFLEFKWKKWTEMKWTLKFYEQLS